MIHISNKQDCCGCTACASICAQNAISMAIDEMGFKYPIVNTNRCTDCGLCEKVCAFHNNYDKSNNFVVPFAYAVRHRNMEEIKSSRSGAMFIALSDYIFRNNGVVYGVGYATHFRAVHKRITNRDDCKELKGSKYVQSDLDGIFHQIKGDLQQGLYVLFVGTPCQTAGLRSFINKKNSEKLLICDIVCHGVPSPLLWDEYLNYMEQKMDYTIEQVNFRDKVKGWAAHYESFIFQNGKKIITHTFTDLFYKHLMFRPSCAVCKYTNTQRPSDITLADFWGWEKVNSDFNKDNMGCSLVLVNSEKGQRVFEAVLPEIHVISTTIDQCLQPNLQHPSFFSPLYAAFWKDYQQKGFAFVLRRYGDQGIRYKLSRLKGKIKQIIKRIIRK
ncbi:F420H(2):quinone oxidoreductase [Parabacteroides sp. An277]|uniref:Coenzyme F420 hydrogenase/dehydrogenase, beta subunit C-terminal domain n=1 Tax=Parabacteroides sp. An277 TaxID=1965619 RepID=UPI000B3824DC|nr:F420H(2):quinone oxidoreductase [Parabacteroides sp. An277]